LPILPDPADEIRAEWGIMGTRVADRGVWEKVGSREVPATRRLRRGACGQGHSGLGEEEVMCWGQGC